MREYEQCPNCGSGEDYRHGGIDYNKHHPEYDWTRLSYCYKCFHEIIEDFDNVNNLINTDINEMDEDLINDWKWRKVRGENN